MAAEESMAAEEGGTPNMNGLLDAVLNSVSDPMLVLSRDQQIIMANSAAEDLFGLNSLPAAVDKALPVSLAEFITLGKLLPEWSPDEEKTFIPRLHAVSPETHTTDDHILVLRDVSQFRKLSRNQYEFMRIVSHDLRSPLTAMQGFANMLELGLVGEINERQGQFIEKILAGIQQMTALVENIQDAGRFDPETGFYEMMRAPCDLMDLVAKVVKEHLIPAEKQELTIASVIADDIPIISADANMLERALSNLMDNAIKYTPNGGKIEVHLYIREDQIRLEVRDNGLGISPENQKRLFQRHIRIARQEHKRIKGSGLGLFIVRSVAQRHGGEAWVESTEGQGSSFIISLPVNGPNQIF
ncbi:MAG: PAS domain-containing sensor histidine kinase [bacterium]|nr:PAS domain-containing sensor histidine kinase [bacterium]